MRRSVEARPARRDQTGFTLLELVIVIILVILFFMTAWWRLMPLRGDAEAAHVATTIGTLRSALGLQVAERIVNDSLDAIAELDGSNPMQLLGQTPGRYIGEIRSADPDTPPGTWYFEKESGRLGYRLRYPQYLVGSPEEPVDLYWQIRAQFSETNTGGMSDVKRGRVRAISLKALHEQRWQESDAAEEVIDPQQ